MERYWAMKRNEVLIYAAMWMALKNVTLSERSQSQKNTIYLYDTIYLKCLKQENLQKQKVDQWLPRDEGGEREWD